MAKDKGLHGVVSLVSQHETTIVTGKLHRKKDLQLTMSAEQNHSQKAESPSTFLLEKQTYVSCWVGLFYILFLCKQNILNTRLDFGQ